MRGQIIFILMIALLGCDESQTSNDTTTSDGISSASDSTNDSTGGVDEGGQAETGTERLDCRDDALRCTDGFDCQAVSDGGYECVPEEGDESDVNQGLGGQIGEGGSASAPEDESMMAGLSVGGGAHLRPSHRWPPPPP